MSLLADVPFRKVTRALTKAGFAHVRTRGSHEVFRGDNGRVVIVPRHPVVKRGTLQSIVRQAGLTAPEFLALLK